MMHLGNYHLLKMNGMNPNAKNNSSRRASSNGLIAQAIESTHLTHLPQIARTFHMLQDPSTNRQPMHHLN
jgi:hypothetical protein